MGVSGVVGGASKGLKGKIILSSSEFVAVLVAGVEGGLYSNQ